MRALEVRATGGTPVPLQLLIIDRHRSLTNRTANRRVWVSPLLTARSTHGHIQHARRPLLFHRSRETPWYKLPLCGRKPIQDGKTTVRRMPNVLGTKGRALRQKPGTINRHTVLFLTFIQNDACALLPLSIASFAPRRCNDFPCSRGTTFEECSTPPDPTRPDPTKPNPTQPSPLQASFAPRRCNLLHHIEECPTRARPDPTRPDSTRDPRPNPTYQLNPACLLGDN